MSEKQRLAKFIAHSGLCSRRRAEDLITSGKVQVNGEYIKNCAIKVSEEDEVIVSGKQISAQEKGVILLHKPRSVVCTASDPEGRETVMKFLPKEFHSYYPAGRLDYDSTGLVVMTNDGALANKLMHPSNNIKRVYMVRVRGIPSASTLERLRRGIELEDGLAQCEPEIVERRGDTTWLEIAIYQGRNRIIRRMIEAVGHDVVKLKRIEHGKFKLGKLKVGEILILDRY